MSQQPSEAGVGLAAEELAGAGATDEFAGVDDGAAAGENCFGRAFDLDALEHGIVHAHVVGFSADDFFVIGIEDDQVGVGANGDGAFARIEAKEFSGRDCNQLDKTVRRKMFAVDPAGIHETQAVLDAGAAIGNLGEIVLAELFLLLEAEGAVVGGNNLQSVFGEALPELFLVPLFAERRSEDILGAFKTGGVHIFQGKIQVLRAGLGVSGQAAVARFADFFERVVAGEMNDVDGRAGHFGESDGTGSGFGFGGGRARERVIFRRALSFGEGLLNDDVDGAAIFRVHADEAAVFGGLAHSLEDRGIIEHEDARVGHEELEAGDAFADELAHFFKLRGAELGDDAVKGVVGDGLVVGFLHPGVERLAEGLALVLDGEVDEGGGAAESGGDSAGLEIVGAGGAAEGHVEVRVDVDAPRNDKHAGRVKDAPRVLRGKLGGDGSDLFAVDADVGETSVDGGYDGAVADYGVKTHLAPLRNQFCKSDFD